MMQNKDYLQNIDKTESLEEGISRFPSIYIEGNAAIGKSTAVKMLLQKFRQIKEIVVDIEREVREPQKLQEKLIELKRCVNTEKIWIIMENMPGIIPTVLAEELCKLVEEIQSESRIIFVSREKPQMEFLELLWRGRMELIPGEKLLFSLEDVRNLICHRESALKAENVFEKTGGWAGCVDLVLRLSKYGKNEEEILNSYEVRYYICERIFSSLKEEERKLFAHIAGCPWVCGAMCEELWGIRNSGEILENLQRKGFIRYEAERNRWSAFSLFERYIANEVSQLGKAHEWYKRAGYIAEALKCLKKSGAEEAYRECMIRHYDKVAALGLISEEVLNWDKKQPEYCYLRGVWNYNVQDFENLEKEVRILKRIKDKDHQIREIILNLSYMNVEMPLDEWLALLEAYNENGENYNLYHMIGYSMTYLCGVRDLSGMFACTKKEEGRKAALWKRALGNGEWKNYQLARVDYYLETNRREMIPDEDLSLLSRESEKQDLWQNRVAKLYLLCKMQRLQPEDARADHIHTIEKSLKKESDPACAELVNAICSLYAPWCGERERTAKWLRYISAGNGLAISEKNYIQFYCRAKGYILLNQYERAERLLKKLVPYLQQFHRYRLAAEVLFQYALVNSAKELQGQSVKNSIESFLVSRYNRYVLFYTEYGKKGQQVLEEYVEWMRSNTPEGWTYKKRYNYGNVLRMPLEDYMQVILRCAKKTVQNEKRITEGFIEEPLTMMETIVLQDIGMGMSNAQICQELGLKLPTVKGHIYSLFKKLEVNNRIQAIIKGKELGLLE